MIPIIPVYVVSVIIIIVSIILLVYKKYTFGIIGLVVGIIVGATPTLVEIGVTSYIKSKIPFIGD